MKQLRKMTLLSTFVVLLSISCHSDNKVATHRPWYQGYKVKSLLLPSARMLRVYMADTPEKQEKGLSGVKSLKENEGMVFSYKSMTPLRFWMPDTYINLDIFFMDEKLNVIYIERNVSAHPGRKEPPAIKRTATVRAQMALELQHGTEAAKSIILGQQLKWLNQRIK